MGLLFVDAHKQGKDPCMQIGAKQCFWMFSIGHKNKYDIEKLCVMVCCVVQDDKGPHL